MDAFIVNKDAWHYRWLCFYNACQYEYYRKRGGSAVRFFENECMRPGDFCQYWRMALLWPAVRIGLNLAIYAVAFRILSGTSGEGALTFGKFVGVLLALAAAAALFAATWVVVGLLFKRLSKSATPVASASSSIVHTAYAAWKGKFCPTLTYEEAAR